jgi:hypothetical protein
VGRPPSRDDSSDLLYAYMLVPFNPNNASVSFARFMYLVTRGSGGPGNAFCRLSVVRMFCLLSSYERDVGPADSNTNKRMGGMYTAARSSTVFNMILAGYVTEA